MIPWNLKCRKHCSCVPPIQTKEELGTRSGIERLFGHIFLFFHLQCPPFSGQSHIASRIALTSSASFIVAWLLTMLVAQISSACDSYPKNEPCVPVLTG